MPKMAMSVVFLLRFPLLSMTPIQINECHSQDRETYAHQVLTKEPPNRHKPGNKVRKQYYIRPIQWCGVSIYHDLQ